MNPHRNSPRPAGARFLAGVHAVREALRAGSPLRFVAIGRDRDDARTRELAELARQRGVAVRRVGAPELDAWSGGRPHQGVVAEAEAKSTLDLESLLADAPRRALLALDGIEDPQNVGAILRAACGAGVDGVLLPSRRAAGLTDAVARASAGAIEHVRCARVGNLVQALEACKKRGWWVVGLDAAAPVSIWRHDFAPPTVLVIGAEGRGLHELTRKRCDALVSIPLAPALASLNAAAAAAVALFELVRQRAAAAGGGAEVP